MTMHDWEVWGTIAFVGVLIVGSIMAWCTTRYRTESLEDVAKRWGWTFFPVGDVELEQEAGRLPLFQRGWGRRLTNAMTGTRDERLMHLFDYEFTIGTGRSARTYRQTVAACAVKASQSVPAFELRPEHVLNQFPPAYGYSEVAFSTHHEFSRRYRLGGVDESGLRRRFRLELLHALIDQPGWSVEGEGEWLLFYRVNQLVDADELEAFQRETAKLARLVVG